MRLRIFLIASSLLTPALSFANNTVNNPFAGVFAGAGLGYTAAKTNITVPDFTTNNDAHKNGLAGEIFAGYNYAIDTHWLVGAELSFRDSNANTKDVIDTISITNKIHQIYNIDGLLGYTFSQSMMLLAGAGFSMATLTASSDDGYSSSHTVNGWNGLLGAQESLTNSVSLRGTISYVNFSSKDVHKRQPAINVSPSNYTGMISLVYTFHL